MYLTGLPPINLTKFNPGRHFGFSAREKEVLMSVHIFQLMLKHRRFLNSKNNHNDFQLKSSLDTSRENENSEKNQP